jgi:RimJ/RimL family protein N-acetyltransferase
MELEAKGQALPFAIVAKSGERIAGSTRYLNIAAEHRRLEIGYTFVGAEWQRTAVNGAAKLLLLGHAFERLGCIRVELKTDSRNAQSRAAIARLGAREEGIFRRHMICADGALRDTVYFSIVAEEWPGIRARLEARLG